MLTSAASDHLMAPENFSQILQDIHAASWNLNLDTQIFNFKFVYADGTEWKDFQISLLAPSVVNLIHSDDRQKIYNDVQASMENGHSFSTQCRINQATECWIEIAGQVHTNSHIISGKVLHVTKAAWLSKFIVLNFNYHIEHHMFPDAPWYTLNQLHKVVSAELTTQYNTDPQFVWIRENRVKSLSQLFRPEQRLKDQTKISA